MTQDGPYLILTAEWPHKLAEEVNLYVAQGYEVLGGVTCAAWYRGEYKSGDKTLYSQAMWRRPRRVPWWRRLVGK